MLGDQQRWRRCARYVYYAERGGQDPGQRCDRLRIKQRAQGDVVLGYMLANGREEWPAWSGGETVLESVRRAESSL
jgi:hypothetical protein